MQVMNNSSSLMALGELKKNESTLGKQLKKVSSGLKINGAGDGASEYAISKRMTVQVRSLGQDQQNVQNGKALVNVALGGLDATKDCLQKMHTLALQAANDTVTDVDRATIQKEVDQLKDQIDDNAFQSTFNGLYPLVPMDGIVTYKEITKPADIVFLIDTTGSMGTPISSVKSSLSSFADALKSAGVDFRFGLISYGDVSEASTVSDDVEKYDLGTDGFTTDVDVLKDALGKLKVRGGGDEPESGLEAIMDPTSGALTYSFRPDASKQLIVVTDATFHTKSDGSAYDIPETVEAMKAAGVTLTGVVSPGAAKTKWDMLVKDTGGTTFAAISGDFSKTLEDYAEALLKSLSGDGGEVEQRLYIQTGTKANQNIMMKITDARAKAIGVSDVKVSPFEEAMKAIGTVTDASTASSMMRRAGARTRSVSMPAMKTSRHRMKIRWRRRVRLPMRTWQRK